MVLSLPYFHFPDGQTRYTCHHHLPMPSATFYPPSVPIYSIRVLCVIMKKTDKEEEDGVGSQWTDGWRKRTRLYVCFYFLPSSMILLWFYLTSTAAGFIILCNLTGDCVRTFG